MSMNMSVSEVRSTLLTYWNANYSETPTEWDNVKFPQDLKTSPHVSFDFKFNNGRTIIKGTGTTTRHSGLIYVDIRVPAMSGTKRAYEIADIVLATLERKRFGDPGKQIWTNAGQIDNDGIVSDYFIVNLSIPFKVA